MRRYGLIFVTTFIVLVTVAVLARAGSRSPRLALLRHEASHPVLSHEPLTSEAALRYRDSVPTHWRACLMER